METINGIIINGVTYEAARRPDIPELICKDCDLEGVCTIYGICYAFAELMRRPKDSGDWITFKKIEI